MLTILVDDLDARIAQLAGRGLEPSAWQTYEGNTCWATFVDPDGNEFGIGSAPR